MEPALHSTTSLPLFLRVLRGEAASPPPIWFMRQAGRYMPEYRAIRAKYSMLDVIRNAELAASVTLQPIDRFGFDAAIIFADILNPLIGMGIDLDFVQGEGPRISNPVRTPSDVEKLRIPDPIANTGYTFEAIRLAVGELQPRGVPLIGFAGAPFTISSYLIEEDRTTQLHDTKKFMLEEPDAWMKLQEKLTEMLAAYLIEQVHAGASALQIFDSWVGVLGPQEFERFVLPHLQRLMETVQAKVDVPVCYFSTGSSTLFPLMRKLPATAFSIDWRATLTEAREVFGPQPALQGNLDPVILAGPLEYLERQVLRILEEGSKIGPYIFNLGHGILPHTPLENVARVVELVHAYRTKRVALA